MSKNPIARIGLQFGSAAMFLVVNEDGQSFVVINADPLRHQRAARMNIRHSKF